MATKTKVVAPDWDALARQYATPQFIASDPIAFAHQYAHTADPRDAECVGFLSALLSYGRRASIQQAIQTLVAPMGPRPVEALCQASAKDLSRWTRGWYYRFNTADDAQFVLTRLQEVYQADSSLKVLWQEALHPADTLAQAISLFRRQFLSLDASGASLSQGLTFLLADPAKKSAAKRFCMFLRWMVRHDAVDLGLWQDVMSPADLVIPLDTHVAKMARKFDITQRKANDWQTAEEITAYFRGLDPKDPVRFDFALFGLGLDGA